MRRSTTSPWIDFNVYLITDRQQTCGRDLFDLVTQALRGGVGAVQLREKDLSTRELYEMAYELRKLTSMHGAKLFINDRLDVALAVDADGVHLGYNSMPIYRVRKVLGDQKLIGVSCHNQINAITAQEKGADFITFGPLYYTPSKAVYGEPVGLEKLQEVSQLLQIPIFGLGGVTCDNAPNVIEKGAHGVALVSGILKSPNPYETAVRLTSMLASLDTFED